MGDSSAYLAEIWTWFRLLPDWSYWLGAGIVAALATAGGLWSRQRYLDQQNELEQERRLADNAQSLRREVYLPAAEAMARAQEFLAKFPGKDWTREDGAVVVDYVNGALGKVHVVGGERAIRTTAAVATEFGISYMTLLARRRPINDLQHEIEHLDGKISHMSYERDQLLAHITRVAGDGLEDQGIWNDLNLRFDKLHRQIANTLDERRGRVMEKNRLRHELALEAARASLKIAKLAVPAYLALREELDMPVDDEEYRAVAHGNIGELEHALQRLGARSGPGPQRARRAQQEPGARPEPSHERNLRMVLQRQEGA